LEPGLKNCLAMDAFLTKIETSAQQFFQPSIGLHGEVIASAVKNVQKLLILYPLMALVRTVLQFDQNKGQLA